MTKPKRPPPPPGLPAGAMPDNGPGTPYGELPIRLYLSAWLEERGVNQVDLARNIGRTRQAVGHWTKGRGFPDLETLGRICAFLEIGIGELLVADAAAPGATYRSFPTGAAA